MPASVSPGAHGDGLATSFLSQFPVPSFDSSATDTESPVRARHLGPWEELRRCDQTIFVCLFLAQQAAF